MHVNDLSTPALIVDVEAFDRNVATMAAARPGPALRPHVKAFKSTALAHELAVAGHTGFCCATTREVSGMAAAGLGQDLLLANEVLDVRRLQAMTTGADARITVAVDSAETVEAAARGGVTEVLVDVNVGLPRCGCLPDEAGRIAERARAMGLTVRGVMGYEGHLMMQVEDQEAKVERAMARLLAAHDQVGGDVVSGGGTGSYQVNRWVTELQAGSYTLMDTQYSSRGIALRAGAARAGHGDLQEPGHRPDATVRGGQRRAQVAEHRPRRPLDRGKRRVVLLRRAHHLRPIRRRRLARARHQAAGGAVPHRPDHRLPRHDVRDPR